MAFRNIIDVEKAIKQYIVFLTDTTETDDEDSEDAKSIHEEDFDLDDVPDSRLTDKPVKYNYLRSINTKTTMDIKFEDALQAVPKNQVLFSTTFTNGTTSDQVHKISSGATHALPPHDKVALEQILEDLRPEATVWLTTGASFGAASNFGIHLPVSEGRARRQFGPKIKFSGQDSEVIKGKNVWATEQVITVPGSKSADTHTKVTANVSIEELHYPTHFKIESVIKGEATTGVTTANGRLRQFVIPLYKAMKLLLKKNNKLPIEVDEDKETVTFTTEGDIELRYAINTNVELTEEQVSLPRKSWSQM